MGGGLVPSGCSSRLRAPAGAVYWPAPQRGV